MIEYLLSRQEINILETSRGNNKTPLHYIAELQVQDSHRELKILKSLVDRGLEINKKSKKQGYTAVHYAALAGNSDAVNLLYFIRADLDVPCLIGATPIQIAAQLAHVEVVEALLEYGVPKSSLFNASVDVKAYPEIILNLFAEPTQVFPFSPSQATKYKKLIF